MRWQEVNPDLRLETLQEEGLLYVAPMAVDNEMAPLAIVFFFPAPSERETPHAATAALPRR